MRTELSTCDFTYVVIGRTSHKLVLALYIQGFPLFLPRPTSSGVCVWVLSRSVMSDSLWPRGLWPARLLGPWDFPGKNTGAGYHFPFQQIFPTWGSNPLLTSPALAGRFFTISAHLGSPGIIRQVNITIWPLTLYLGQDPRWTGGVDSKRTQGSNSYSERVRKTLSTHKSNCETHK